MLNKNQSNKRNSWKYAVVLPLLGAFLFFFQVKVVAQEKVNPKQENETRTEAIDLTKFKVDKDLITLSKGKEIYINGEKSSQEELDKLDPKEIVSIDVIQKNSNPTILVTTKNVTNQLSKTIKITDKDIYIDGVKSTNEEFSKLDKNTVENVNVDTFENTVRITTKTINISADNFENKTISKQKPIIILNGKRTLTTFEDLNKLDPNLIQSMNVLKGKSAVDKYGKEGENGAIEIITKENADLLKYNSPSEIKETVVNGWKVSAIPATRNLKEMLVDDKNMDYKKAVIIIDGKLSNSKKLNKLNPDEIARISVQKTSDGKQKDEMVQKYGKKALNGVIEIETKRNANLLIQSQNKTKEETELDKSEIENTGNEIVSSKEQWLETYKVMMKARFGLEKMKAQKEQAKADLEKSRKALKSKLFS